MIKHLFTDLGIQIQKYCHFSLFILNTNYKLVPSVTTPHSMFVATTCSIALQYQSSSWLLYVTTVMHQRVRHSTPDTVCSDASTGLQCINGVQHLMADTVGSDALTGSRCIDWFDIYWLIRCVVMHQPVCDASTGSTFNSWYSGYRCIDGFAMHWTVWHLMADTVVSDASTGSRYIAWFDI